MSGHTDRQYSRYNKRNNGERQGKKKRRMLSFAFAPLLIFLLVVIVLYSQRTIIDVAVIKQEHRYPTGCESVTTVMALNNLGIDITVDEFIDNYLDMGRLPFSDESGNTYGGSPWRAFLGSPYSEDGFGCYAPVIANSISKFIDYYGAFEVKTLYGEPLEKLCSNYLDNGIPVILWGTMEMKSPRVSTFWIDEETGERIDWIAPMHCLLLVGYDSFFYYFNDPQKGKCVYKKSDVEAAYNGMYMQAVVVYPQG